MNKATEETRQAARDVIAGVVEDALKNHFVQVKTWTQEDVIGPLGGVSHQVVAAIELDRQVVPVTIAIYSDDRIADLLERVLDEEQEQDELRKRLGWT